ncbi:hypothetical protein CF65_02444 [Aggregatibacter actinomycetemcomitans HK1651]|nr:hypothetical protein CF65_02444 [Aggregatibacter actinomycetemcomitans HK1651]
MFSKNISKTDRTFPLFLQRFHIACHILHILFAEGGFGAVAGAFDFTALAVLQSVDDLVLGEGVDDLGLSHCRFFCLFAVAKGTGAVIDFLSVRNVGFGLGGGDGAASEEKESKVAFFHGWLAFRRVE